MNVPNPVQTPVGAGASSGGIVALIFNVILPPVWPWWAHQPTAWTGAVEAVLVFGVGYLGGWLNVRAAAGRKVTLSVAQQTLPGVKASAEPPAG